MELELESRHVDTKHRVVMPKGCRPGSLVTIQELDADTWLVKRQRPRKDCKIVRFQPIASLPDDPEWEKVEQTFVRHATSPHGS